jgi:small neutral amino acid transporter SnatA (MarC family)
MLFSAVVANYTSKNLLNVFSILMALVLASLAIQFIINGIKSTFGI